MPRVWNRVIFSALRQSTVFHTCNPVLCSTRLIEYSSVSVNRKFASWSNVCFTRTCTKKNPACWKCGVSVDLNKVLFCKFCEVVQKPDQNADYFKVLLQKQTFDIDTADLTKKFRLLQMQLHPDKFSHKTEVIIAFTKTSQ